MASNPNRSRDIINPQESNMYMFVYVMKDKLNGLVPHVVQGDNFHSLLETARLVRSGAQVSALAFIGPVTRAFDLPPHAPVDTAGLGE